MLQENSMWVALFNLSVPLPARAPTLVGVSLSSSVAGACVGDSIQSSTTERLQYIMDEQAALDASRELYVSFNISLQYTTSKLTLA